MKLIATLVPAATIAACACLGAGTAPAAPVFTQAGDATFRTIVASGGTLVGVDVSSATVLVGGISTALTTLAAQAAQAVPASMAGQPNGWLKLDGNGLVPIAALPAAASGVDQIARTAAAAAQAVAQAAEPASMAGKAGGWAALDANALVPLAALPASVTSPVDSTARSAAAAAQTLAAAAEPAGSANRPGGWPQLDGNGAVSPANLPASVTNPTDSTARSAAASAQSAANAAQTLAAAAVPSANANRPNGWPQLDANGAVPIATLPAAVTNPVDQTARNSAAAAQALAASALPASQANGFPQLDGNALIVASELPVNTATLAVQNGLLTVVGGTSTDSTARAAAASAQSTANAAEPSSQGGKSGGFPLLDGNALVPTANLPAAYTSATAIATSSLGQANGPAQLGPDGTLSTNTVLASIYGASAKPVSDAHEVDGELFGLRCGSKAFDSTASTTAGSNILHVAGYKFTWRDVGATLAGSYQMGVLGQGLSIASVNANGDAVMSANAPATTGGGGVLALAEDDTAAFQAWIAGAGKWTHTDMVLPAGECRLSAEIDVPVYSSMHFHGRGPGASTLSWSTPTNGLVFTIYTDHTADLYNGVSNVALGSNFELSDLVVRRMPNTNTTMVGTGITVQSAPDAAGVAQSSNAQDVVEHDLLIEPSTVNQHDGWLTGIENVRLAGATVYDISVGMPGYTMLPNAKNLPNPIWGQPSPQWPGNSNGANTETVTASAASGQSVVSVADATSFQVGQRVTFPDANVEPRDYNNNPLPAYIQSISGNNVTLNEKLSATLATTYSDQAGSHPMPMIAESTPNLTNWHSAQTGASASSAAGQTVISVTDATNAWVGEVVTDLTTPASLPPLQTVAEGTTGAAGGQTVITVSSPTNLYAGEPVYDMTVRLDAYSHVLKTGYLPPGTTIKSISGLSITLSNNLTGAINPGDTLMAGAYRVTARNTTATPNTITVNGSIAGAIAAADRISIQAAGNSFNVCDGANICNTGANGTIADPNGGGFSIDTMMDGIHTSGGLSGIRCYYFQGCYITNETAVADPYGVLADSPPQGQAGIGELLNVANSQFSTQLCAVYSNVVDQHMVQNYIADDGWSGGVTIPDFVASWSRTSGSSTIEGNFFQLGGDTAGNELGVYFSCDTPTGGGFCGFPATVGGNALYGTNGYGISNSIGISNLLVTGNNASGGTFDATISSSSPTGSNAYAANITGVGGAPDYADEAFVTQGSAYHDLYLHELVVAGDGYTSGKFVASYGNNGNRVSAAWLDGASGSVCSANGGAHVSCRATMGGYSATSGATFSLTNVAGALFAPASSGEITVYGEATCTGPGVQGSWHIIGHYNISGGAASPSGFLASLEGDSDTTYAFGGSSPRITAANGPTFSLSTAGIGIKVVLGASSGGLWDCSADLGDMLTN